MIESLVSNQAANYYDWALILLELKILSGWEELACS
jgi:hypothetical protein